MTDPNPTSPPRSETLRRVLLGAAFVATFFAGAVAASAPVALAMMSEAHAMHGHGHSHAMMEAHVDRMLSEVDATADQKQRINAILQKGFTSIEPVHEKLAAAHGDIHRLLAAPTVDRAALEQIRAARMSDLDQTSKVMVQTLADAADVLRPEQRAKLAAIMDRHHHEHV